MSESDEHPWTADLETLSVHELAFCPWVLLVGAAGLGGSGLASKALPWDGKTRGRRLSEDSRRG